VAAESIHPLKGESHQGPCSCLQSIVFTADLAAAAPALFSPPSPTPLQQVFFLVLSFRFHFSFTPKHFRCLFLRPVPSGPAIWVVLATRFVRFPPLDSFYRFLSEIAMLLPNAASWSPKARIIIGVLGLS
jgi:hypothetical protein